LAKVRAAWVSGLIGAAALSAVAKDPAPLSLTPEHFQDTASVRQDAALGTTTISTEPGFVQHRGPLRTVWNDEYLKAVINETTGQKSFEVDVSFTYNGSRLNYTAATFQSGGTTQTTAVVVGKPGAINCPTGECTYTEHIHFPVDETLLRQLAAGPVQMWGFKVVTNAGGRPSGGEYAGALSTAEMSGLLAKVDELSGGVAATLAATGSAAPGAPAAGTAGARSPAVRSAPPRDLGVGAMRVDAADESPPRAGLLLTAVNRGSAAQKSGLLVGDILYEADGRAIQSLSDLKAVLAASRSKSALTLKLYRGTDKLTVTAQF
jgi:hypothetical protein